MDAMLLRASLVLGAMLFAALFLRRGSPYARHRYWTFAFAAILALPLLVRTMPGVDVPLPDRWVAPGRPPSPLATSVPPSRPPSPAATSVPAGDLRPPSRPPSPPPTSVPSAMAVRSLLLMIWAMGAAIALIALVVSLLRVRRLARGASEILDPSWLDAVSALRSRLGLRAPIQLLVSDAVATPMAGRVWRPTVFLPAGARDWPADHRDVVLAHELTHLASRDALRHLLMRVTAAIYWFHPLMWLAARQAAQAREEACDAAVLALGTRPSVYARVLLDLAESMQPRPRLLTVLPMVQRSLLEMRVMVILKNARPAGRRFAALPLIGVGLFTIAVAAAQPAGSSPDTERRAITFMDGGSAPTDTEALSQATPRPTPLTQTALARVAMTQTAAGRDCWNEGMTGSFSGSSSSTTVGGRTVIYEQVGWRGNSRVIQKTFGDLRLCFVADGLDDRMMGAPRTWVDTAPRFIMEARRGNAVQQLEGVREAGGSRLTWRVNGQVRPLDAAAQQWRERILSVFDTTWELSSLRGEVSSLRGQISSVRGRQSSLRGEISSLRGQVSSMRGRISSARGEESSLRGEISSIRGHESSLRGAISAEHGAISSLKASGAYRATEAERQTIANILKRHEAEIARLEKEREAYNVEARVAEVEKRLAALDTEGKVAAIEGEIRAFDVESRVREIERQIEALNVEGKVAEIEKQIAALDADRRAQQLETRRDAELKQLAAAIAAIR